MKRVFSVLRRKSGFVDISVPLVQGLGVEGYRFKASTNWDVAPTTLFTAGLYGYMDSELQATVVPTVDHRPDAMRVLFKPSKYTVSGNPLTDTGVFWLQLVYIVGNAEQNAASATPPSAITMISSVTLPYNSMQAIQGTAPNQGTLANATQIDLGRQVENVTIENQGGADMFVAFDEGGPEFAVKAGKDMHSFQGTVSSVWVRGSGSTVPFRMSFVNANPR
jgi:hypothetical protein